MDNIQKFYICNRCFTGGLRFVRKCRHCWFHDEDYDWTTPSVHLYKSKTLEEAEKMCLDKMAKIK